MRIYSGVLEVRGRNDAAFRGGEAYWTVGIDQFECFLAKLVRKVAVSTR